MKDLLKKTYAILATTACLLILSGSSCNNDNTKKIIKKNNTKYSGDKEKQEYFKKKQPKTLVDLDETFDENDDIAFLDNLSTQKTTDIELEIKKLIAMLDKEESILEKKISSEPYQTVLFDQESREIDIDQLESINKAAKQLAKSAKNGKKIIIRGHSDILETDNSNAFSLAENRALAVKDELIKLNIPASQIEISSVGATEPIVFGFNSDTQATENLANRRVEIWTA